MEIDHKSILDMAMGAFKERVDYEMAKVVDNILDPNTKAAKKRSLVLQVDIMPDDNRQHLAISTTVKSKLEPTNAVTTSLYITGDENGIPVAVEMVPQVPGQLNVYGEEQESPAILKLVKNA